MRCKEVLKQLERAEYRKVASQAADYGKIAYKTCDRTEEVAAKQTVCQATDNRKSADKTCYSTEQTTDDRKTTDKTCYRTENIAAEQTACQATDNRKSADKACYGTEQIADQRSRYREVADKTENGSKDLKNLTFSLSHLHTAHSNGIDVTFSKKKLCIFACQIGSGEMRNQPCNGNAHYNFFHKNAPVYNRGLLRLGTTI